VRPVKLKKEIDWIDEVHAQDTLNDTMLERAKFELG